MVFRQLTGDRVTVMEKRHQKDHKITALPILMESICREWVERIIGRSLVLSEYRKMDRKKHNKRPSKNNDNGPQNLEGAHPAQGMRIWRRGKEDNGDGEEGSWDRMCLGSQTNAILWTSDRQAVKKMNTRRQREARRDMRGHPKQICLIRSFPGIGFACHLIQQPSGFLWVIYKVTKYELISSLTYSSFVTKMS